MSRHPSHALADAWTRRRFLSGLGAAGAATILLAGGCGYYRPAAGDAYAPWAYPDRALPPELAAVHAAILAASPHNTQPWLFAVTPERIDLHAALDRNLGTMDGLYREMYIGLGCALENLVIAARHHGRAPAVTYLPDAGDETHVARIELAPGEPATSPLHAAIARRHTHRGAYADDAPPAGLEAALRALIAADEVDAVSLRFLASATDKARFRAGTIAATEAIAADREMSHDSHAWYRHGKDDIDEHRDGVTLDATGASATTRTLGKLTSRPSAGTANEYWLDATRGRQTTAAAFCILSTPARNDRRNQLLCGRVYQRMHLWAETQGLAMQPLNQMAERQDREEALGLAGVFTGLLAELVGQDGAGAQMLFRTGYAWDTAQKSPRRPLEWVLA